MGKTILLVEDDEFIRGNVCSLLQQEGYQTAACSCLEEARAALRRSMPDLVILDVLLPDGSGFAFCRKIRECYKVPILFLTCCDEDEDIIKGLEYGGDDYVSKPFRAKVLLSRIMALLRRTQLEQGAGLKIDVFRFDDTKRVCHIEGEPVALTPIEYRILWELAKSANTLVSRGMLLHTIWDLGCEYMDENTLSVHISRLRGKLGKHSDKLVTVRGEGYILRCQSE